MINLDTVKFCIWGFRENYHTHRHIQEGFYRALNLTGKQVIWVDAEDALDGIDFSNTLFISEGQRAAGMPRRDDCFYVVHNIDASNSLSYFDGLPLLRWGVRTMRLPLAPGRVQLGDQTFYWPGLMEFPWATDLLPREIQANKPSQVFRSNSRIVNWVASGWQGAGAAVKDFSHACRESGIEFRHYGHLRRGTVSIEDNVRLIKESYMAPTLASPEQLNIGYIPCRILKNISYGQYGVTNSDAVRALLGDRVVYNPDSYQLFYDARTRLPQISLTELHFLMDYVAENHTYLNRIDAILRAARLMLENR